MSSSLVILTGSNAASGCRLLSHPYSDSAAVFLRSRRNRALLGVGILISMHSYPSCRIQVCIVGFTCTSLRSESARRSTCERIVSRSPPLPPLVHMGISRLLPFILAILPWATRTVVVVVWMRTLWHFRPRLPFHGRGLFSTVWVLDTCTLYVWRREDSRRAVAAVSPYRPLNSTTCGCPCPPMRMLNRTAEASSWILSPMASNTWHLTTPHHIRHAIRHTNTIPNFQSKIITKHSELHSTRRTSASDSYERTLKLLNIFFYFYFYFISPLLV